MQSKDPHICDRSPSQSYISSSTILTINKIIIYLIYFINELFYKIIVYLSLYIKAILIEQILY